MSTPIAYLIQFAVIGIPVLLYLFVRKNRVLSPMQRVALAVAMAALSYGAAYYFAAAHGWRLPSQDGKSSIFGPAATAAFPGVSVFMGCIVLAIWKRGAAVESKP
jgi:hypothetical protein